VPTLALSYNYYKRTQGLATLTQQRHLQIGSRVLDSRPAVALRQWSEEEWVRARRFELQAMGIALPPDPNDQLALELPTSGSGPDGATPLRDADRAQDALYCYDIAARLCDEAPREYRRHLTNYGSFMRYYAADLDRLDGLSQMFRADHAYLSAMLATDDAARRDALLANAAAAYEAANARFNRMLLKYYVHASVLQRVAPPDVTRDNIDEQPMTVLQPIIDQLRNATSPQMVRDMVDYANVWYEYGHYIQRCMTRLARIRQASPATGAPAASAAPAPTSR
jgi:hypothetical protein